MAPRMFVLLAFTTVALFLQGDALRADENNRLAERIDPQVEVQEEKNVKNKTEELFSYLRSGNTKSILDLLTGSLLEERRELLEENGDYERFLRHLYENTSIVTKRGRRIDKDTRTIDVNIYFNNEEPPLQTRFILKREHGLWKIADEVDSDL
jgi:hypothetical protein